MALPARITRKITIACLTALAAAAHAAVPAQGAPGQGGTSAQGATVVTPLPASDYTVRPVCGEAAAGSASCLSLSLVPRTEAAAAHRHPLGMARLGSPQAPSPGAGSFGLRPQDVHSAYALPTVPPAAQTVAIVDAFNDPNAEADLKSYSEAFGLPECTTANGCFREVNEHGEVENPPFPRTVTELENAKKGTTAERHKAAQALQWGLEISLDIEAVHATCETCAIVLAEASTPSDEDLDAAEQTAVSLGAAEISNSWGGAELGASSIEKHFEHPGVVITASAGDNGYLDWSGEAPGYAEFPASSPNVVAVGGTRLSVGAGGAWAGESVWNGYGAGGGGCSIEFTAPAWQQSVSDWTSVGCAGRRSVADVSADADPYTGLAVHDSSAECETKYEEGGVKHTTHWCTVGGTSLASPLIASVFALAGGSHGVPYAARTLYEDELLRPAALHDVRAGSNGECTRGYDEEGTSECTPEEEAQRSCSGQLRCLAAPGYDGPTGVGTPDGIEAFRPQSGPEALSAPSAAAGAAAPPAQAAPAAAPGPALEADPPPASRMRVSALSLTARSAARVRSGRATLARVAFVFNLSAAGLVREALSRRALVHARPRWVLLGPALTVAAARGRNHGRMRGRRALTRGTYRLVLTPAAGGRAMTIIFTIR